jgi:hypothetical protein
MEPNPTPVREIPPPPAKAPRPLTAEARRSILLEPRVRRWWYMGLMTLLMFAAFCADRLWARHTETELIRTGQVVTAKIAYADNKQNNQPFSSSDKANLIVMFPGGNEELDGVYLTDGGMTGHTITLHVDPRDHSRWTDRSEPTPLLASLIVGLIALPIVPLLLAFGVRQRRAMQRIWQNGTAALAVVHERKQSPIAPMSYALRCCMHDLRTRDLFTVYVPRIGNGLEKGDLIWVITAAKKGNPLAALWMPPSTQSGST